MRRTSEWLPLIVVLAIAAAARVWYLAAGIPYAVAIDEPQVVDRALRILHTGSWNTHLFDYPTLVIYLHACVQIVRFLWGALNGEWASLDGFSIDAVYLASRFVTAMIGTATVWLTWRLARDLASSGTALLAAGQLAVRSMHVRESHYILTDVPMTALTTLAVWLAVRAARLRTTLAYLLAGAACGAAAAAKYNGGIALAAVVGAWFVADFRAPDRWKKAGAAVAAAALAFAIAAPYTILDMPSFLDGFAAQFARFSAPSAGVEPAWLTYAKHLSPASSPWSIPLALAGALLVLRRSSTRTAWLPLLAFTGCYFYVLASHSHVLGRYALPLLPPICILTSVGAIEIIAALRARIAMFSARPAALAIWTVALVLLVLVPGVETVRWLEGLKRVDTRTMAADWLSANMPRGTRLAVENSGPTYLESAGFRVVGSEMLIDRPLDWYRQRADALVVSAADLSRYGDYLNAGPTMFQVLPTAQRWGPPIRIVALRDVHR